MGEVLQARKPSVFGSVQDVEAVFRRGIEFHFLPLPGNIMGRLLSPDEIFIVELHNGSWQGTNGNILLGQKISFVRELLRVHNFPLPGESVFDEEDEKVFDAEAKRIVAEEHALLEALVKELSRRPNCLIRYSSHDLEDNPFFWFHRELVSEMVRGFSGRKLEFGDSSLVRILHYAREMDAFAEECGIG